MQPVKAARTPLKVYITIDTEVWPHVSQWRETRLAEDIDRDIYGQAAGGNSGLEVQLQMFQAEGLKAIFFVEPFSSLIAGIDSLKRTVGKIHDYRQDVQAHPHTEWLQWIETSQLQGKTGRHLRSFSFADQVTLIRWALSLLAEAGAPNVRALRAGNFGANRDTLRAAAAVGLEADFSLNHCALHQACEIYTDEPLLQPAPLEGITEYPMAFFRDRPNHFRQAQVCACSTSEMIRALEEGWRKGWNSFVILMHSFEFLLGRKDPGSKPRLNLIGLRRFEALCRFLARNRDRFETVHHQPSAADGVCSFPMLNGLVWNTAVRYCEQLYIRLA